MNIFIFIFLGLFVENVNAYESVTLQNSNSRIYGNRFFIFNRLGSIFGSEAKELLEEQVLHGHSDLGGPCDIYQQVYREREKVLDQKTKCLHGKVGATASLNGKNTLIRSAYIARTCSSLIEEDRIVKRLIQKNNKRDLNTGVKQIYLKFYPFDDQKKLLEKVSKKIQSSHSKDFVRMAHLYFCLSERWQTL